MTEKITVDKTVIDNLVKKASIEPTGDTNDWNEKNPAWVDGYKEGMLQAVNAIMTPVYFADQQPLFAVGEYYADHHAIYKITAENKVTAFVFRNKKLNDKLSLDVLINTPLSPATAEQIATFKRAEHFASKGRKLDEFRVGDEAEDERHKGIVTAVTNDNYLYIKRSFAGGSISSMESVNSCTLIQTAEELQGGS